MTQSSFDCTGVIPACLLPLHQDLSLDVVSYRKHLNDIAAVRGVSAITVNGHASEVSSCTFDEQQQLLEVACDQVGDRMPVVAGVYADGTAEAVRLARMADRGGASALLVFPPNVFAMGSRPEMVLAHFSAIADATSLPLIIFQFPVQESMSYSHDVLATLIESVPTIRAMKDGSGDPVRSEMAVRDYQSDTFSVLSTHSAWLLQSLVVGCKGLLSGAGSTVAAMQVELFEAVQNHDLKTAQAAAERLYSTTKAFYRRPSVDMHTRMKAAQVLLGRLPSAAVRPPLQQLPADEIALIGDLMKAAGVVD
ncbi:MULTISPECIES: dihydrodipicolinate synthase family protein [Mycobacteriaceae]|uniref:dihydrodipicolinate synthase family protein n=1 Tax=Mycobacteriaceae TaxID=1762 RepID=UPI0009A7F412|nr:MULTISPECIES: dihydrodipicolinate synthase family protein [Mycobacteriaceae]QZH61220.1 dihydrodipicolinate synthase family protein [Mycolicibacterium farcinogenes]SKQ86899.1 dihydrodipicolinate synthase [Mycobacteroides abscessus subsp. massiliense]